MAITIKHLLCFLFLLPLPLPISVSPPFPPPLSSSRPLPSSSSPPLPSLPPPCPPPLPPPLRPPLPILPPLPLPILLSLLLPLFHLPLLFSLPLLPFRFHFFSIHLKSYCNPFPRFFIGCSGCSLHLLCLFFTFLETDKTYIVLTKCDLSEQIYIAMRTKPGSRLIC